MAVPVSVVIVTKNAATLLPRCLASLGNFDDIHIVDSDSRDLTEELAMGYGAHYTLFKWNGFYPKKRQWCLQNLDTKYDWWLFLDADELMTPALAREIRKAIAVAEHDAWFIRSKTVFCGHTLHYGRQNNKIVLFRRDAVNYPTYPDAQIDEMGEIEGHYQPVISGSIGQLREYTVHHCANTIQEWNEKHRRYAVWQAAMESFGHDFSHSETGWRRLAKKWLPRLPLRPALVFLDSFILQLGFLDGRSGYDYALARARYYRLIDDQKKAAA